MEKYSEPLEDATTKYLLPSVVTSVTNKGILVTNIVERATSEHQASPQINASLIAIMMVQGNDLPSEEERKNVFKLRKRKSLSH